MTAKIVNITPAHKPISLAKEMVERAPESSSALCVLVQSDGKLWYDMAGHRQLEILWALQRMIHILMSEAEKPG